MTRLVCTNPITHEYFNPHEREARDTFLVEMNDDNFDFNPHEREARDPESHLPLRGASLF